MGATLRVGEQAFKDNLVNECLGKKVTRLSLRQVLFICSADVMLKFSIEKGMGSVPYIAL